MALPAAHPAFPCDLDGLLAAGVADGLTTLEVGALYRLVRFAWRQDPPCSLPGEDSSLAMVAGVTDEEWSRLRPRILLALAVTQTAPPTHGPAGGSTGRVSLGHTRRIYDDLAARAAKNAADKRAAGLASARSRGSTCSTGAEQVLNRCSAPVAAAPSLRSSSLSIPAPTLQRSSHQSAIQSAQSERSSGEDVIAVLGEGARAILAEKVSAWRREQSLRLLQEAIAKWRAAGLTTCPVSKSSEIAAGEHSDPARVEYLIGEADAMIAQEQARGRRCNPVGLVIAGVGLSEKRRGRPADVPMFVSERWAKLQASTLQLLEAQAALSAKLARARTAIQAADKVTAQGVGRA